MSMENYLNEFIDELIQEVEQELEEATATGNVAGYNTPFAFGTNRKKDKKKEKETATQAGYTLAEGIIQDREKQLKDLKQGGVVNGGGYGPFKKTGRDTFVSPKGKKYNVSSLIKLIGTFGDFKINESIVTEAKDEVTPKQLANLQRDIKKINPKIKVYISKHPITKGKLQIELGSDHPANQGDDREITKINALLKKHTGDWRTGTIFTESKVNEAKVKRPVNRWLELKNDETMHPHKKMAMGLKELKYQLREVEKFFSWYNKIKTMNELDSQNYWKRTNNHIYKIKERLINIAKTIKEIEK